uniref:Uncharacterized protein n=1 Tax=Solanum tuberosum TaxID=4113 RepID=M1B0L9_SOLTU
MKLAVISTAENSGLALEAVVQQRLESTTQRIPCPRHIVLLSGVLIFAHPQILAQRES